MTSVAGIGLLAFGCICAIFGIFEVVFIITGEEDNSIEEIMKTIAFFGLAGFYIWAGVNLLI